MISKSSPETESSTSCEELYIANEKLARKCLLRFFPALEIVSRLDSTERGDGGFGSTGK